MPKLVVVLHINSSVVIHETSATATRQCALNHATATIALP